MQSVTDEHYTESGRHHWPLRKILGSLIIVLIIFSSGVAVGKGNFQLWGGPGVVRNRTPSNLDYSSVDAVYNLLKNNYDGKLDASKLITGAKEGLVASTGDPYTEYFDPVAAKDFNNQLSGSITGIGAELGKDAQNNIVIISPLSGYPAEKAGLKPKDIIAAVDSQSTQGLSIDEVVRKIRGQEGTKVTLTVVRGAQKPLDMTITRQKISVPSVSFSLDNDVGYIKISQFGSDTVGLAKKAAQEFKNKQVKGVVLDLRSDPGGYLNSAVGVSSLWLEKGKIVVQERAAGQVVSTETANGDNILAGLPTVVLIDGGSASASEITAGALRDNGVAQLVGVKSFGKGSVQKVVDLKDGSELKVTIARWYTPKGKNIDKQGITPDVISQISDQDAAAGKDTQKEKALSLVQAKF